MGLDVVFKSEIQDRLLAGVVFVVRCAQRQGGDPMFVAGILAMAEYRALGEGLDWPAMLSDAREVLGANVAGLIDQALTLDAGTVLEVDHA